MSQIIGLLLLMFIFVIAFVICIRWIDKAESKEEDNKTEFCPHCGSTNVSKVNGVYYCFDCDEDI